MAPVYYKKMAFIAFFNAGCARARYPRPLYPREGRLLHSAITAATDKRCVTIDGKERCKVADPDQQCRDDERGYIYIRRPRQYRAWISSKLAARRAPSPGLPSMAGSSPCRVGS